jgi:hypothetical protein
LPLTVKVQFSVALTDETLIEYPGSRAAIMGLDNAVIATNSTDKKDFICKFLLIALMMGYG